jgi:hypothetical protein
MGTFLKRFVLHALEIFEDAAFRTFVIVSRDGVNPSAVLFLFVLDFEFGVHHFFAVRGVARLSLRFLLRLGSSLGFRLFSGQLLR